MRAIVGLPLGRAKRHSNAVMTNLIGDDAENWFEIASDANSCLHLYGKKEARNGRKMGHVTVVHENIERAREIAERVKNKIKVISK